MGRDHLEDAKGNKSTQRARKGGTERGCFIGLNPTDQRKEQALELGQAPHTIAELLQESLQMGVVVSLRADRRSGAFLVTLTRTAEDFKDNQTIGAYHIDPMRALCLVLVYWEREYAAVADWSKLSRQLALDW